GCGAFLDATVLPALRGELEQCESFAERVAGELQKHYVDTHAWAIVPVLAGGSAHVAFFSSGYGDGGYCSYWGMDKHGNATLLLTDFEIIPDPNAERCEPEIDEITPEFKKSFEGNKPCPQCGKPL